MMKDAITGDFGQCSLLPVQTIRSSLALPKLNAREALEANETAVEDVLQRFEALGTGLERQRRAWERFDRESKKLESELMVAGAEGRPPSADAQQRLADCALVADKIVRLSGSAAAKSALGDRLAALNTRIKNPQTASVSVSSFVMR